MATDHLLPALRASRTCPFATLADFETHELQFEVSLELGTTRIICACGARSPFGRTHVEAVKRWNTRYTDTKIAEIERLAGASVIAAQNAAEEHRKNLAAMQVENNKLLERARTAEAALELTTKLAEKAAVDHG